MNLSRVLHTDDYKLFTEHLAIDPIIEIIKRNYRYEHEHRKWEYGLALKALLNREDFDKVETVLDVGGGGSILSPLLAYYGFNVTQLDPGYGEKEVEYQNQFSAYFKHKIKFIYGDFSKEQDIGKYDAVISISTIEHVPDDLEFFKNMLKHSSKLIFLTTDFHPSGETFSDAHLRTYNKDSLYKFRKLSEGSLHRVYLEDSPNYTYKGNFVYDYTFATLFLKKYRVMYTSGH